MGYGDRLASGGRSATFPSVSKKMTQKQWDEMWEPEKESAAEADFVRLESIRSEK